MTPTGFDIVAKLNRADAAASKLRTAIERKYSLPQWAFFGEIRNSAGFFAKRRLDGLAFGLWPSRGCKVHGFEIKVSRDDWLRELRNPAKAETFAGFLDRFFIVVPDRSIIKDGELPPAWGLIAPYGRGLRVYDNGDSLFPERQRRFDRYFVAALLKRVLILEDTERDTIEARAHQQAREEITNRIDERKQALESEIRQLKTAIEQFEKISGVRIRKYDGENVGLAFRLALSGDYRIESYRGRLDSIRSELRRYIEEIDRYLDSEMKTDG